MRTKKTTKKVKKQSINFIVSNPSLKEFFLTPEVTSETLESLRQLSESKGWKVIQAYIQEQQNAIANQLLKVPPDNPLAIADLQNQSRIRGELTNLPQELIDLVVKTTSPESFDPYKN